MERRLFLVKPIIPLKISSIRLKCSIFAYFNQISINEKYNVDSGVARKRHMLVWL
jgi:hypothetical protein